jgi:hypothetical protein
MPGCGASRARRRDARTASSEMLSNLSITFGIIMSGLNQGAEIFDLVEFIEALAMSLGSPQRHP